MLLSKSIQSVSSAFISSLIKILILIYSSKMLGAEGRGVYTYFITTIALVQLVVCVIGSSTLVNMSNKIGVKPVFALSTIWSILISVFASCLLCSFNSLFQGYFWILFVLIFSQAIFMNLSNYYIFLTDFVKLSLHRICQPLIFLILLYINKIESPYQLIEYQVYSYLPFIFIFIFIFIKIWKAEKQFQNLYDGFKMYFKLGILAQFANAIQFGSYRFTVWLLLVYASFSDVGIFGLWLNFSDAVWLVSTNIAHVNYANVARGGKSINLTRVSIQNFLFVTFLCIVFYLIPYHLYEKLLGRDFLLLKDLILLSALGLSTYAVNKMFSSYLAGLGLIKYNTISSIAGFLALMFFSFPLVRNFGLKGAVISNTISYVVTTIVTLIIYKYVYKPTVIDE